MEGAEELGTDGKDNGTEGLQPTGLGYVFQVIVAGGSSIRFGDVNDEPLHGQVPGKFPEQVRQADYRESVKATR